jgi:mRNA interferase YafQ
MLELASEKTLPEANYDHPLIGNYSGYRECHIAGDWLWVYKVIGNQIFFARTGTHTDIFD